MREGAVFGPLPFFARTGWELQCRFDRFGKCGAGGVSQIDIRQGKHGAVVCLGAAYGPAGHDGKAVAAGRGGQP